MRSEKQQNLPIWIYGINTVQSLLNTYSNDIKEIWFARGKNDSRIQALCKKAQATGIHCSEHTIKEIDGVTHNGVHQNIAAFCKISDHYLGERDLDALSQEELPLFLILDCITDPGNFGACLRSAELHGVTAVIIPSDRSAKLTPAAIKAASGAIGNTQIVQVPNLTRAIQRIKKHGVWVIAADMTHETNLDDLDYCRPIAFVLGSEGKGIRQLVRKHCDQAATIPSQGSIENFNVSAATAIVLYEACRQRRASPNTA